MIVMEVALCFNFLQTFIPFIDYHCNATHGRHLMSVIIIYAISMKERGLLDKMNELCYILP